MKLAGPRNGRYYGMPIQNITVGETWLEGEEFCYPAGGMTRRCRARCEDGKLRVFRCGIPDTFFSIPANGKVNNRSVRGFITSDEDGFKFNQYQEQQQTGNSAK